MYAMGVDHPQCTGSENVVSTLLALLAVRRRGRGGARVFGSVGETHDHHAHNDRDSKYISQCLL